MVESLQASPSSPVTLGVPVTLTAVTKNNVAGTTASPSTSRLRITVPDGVTVLQDIPYAVQQLNGLASQTDSATFSAGPYTGVYTIQDCADDSNVVQESNEGNNCQSLNVNVACQPTVGQPCACNECGCGGTIGCDGVCYGQKPTPCKPDLIVNSIILTPSTPSAGQQVTLSATIRNEGPRAVASSSNARVHFTAPPGVIIDDIIYTINPLPAYGTQFDQAVLTAGPAGTYTIQICTDDSNVIDEVNEFNNCNSLTVNVQ
ncbi:hypothetical protein HYX00_03890 [Candidatus Woesearchaeota archaeon]|nr:hypothetical protein [Candidatus Woesearchaeota archaeon]